MDIIVKGYSSLQALTVTRETPLFYICGHRRIKKSLLICVNPSEEQVKALYEMNHRHHKENMELNKRQHQEMTEFIQTLKKPLIKEVSVVRLSGTFTPSGG